MSESWWQTIAVMITNILVIMTILYLAASINYKKNEVERNFSKLLFNDNEKINFLYKKECENLNKLELLKKCANDLDINIYGMKKILFEIDLCIDMERREVQLKIGKEALDKGK